MAPNRAQPTHPIAVSMSEKVAPECTAHPDTKARRRSSLSEIADEGIRAAGSGHRSSIAGHRPPSVVRQLGVSESRRLGVSESRRLGVSESRFSSGSTYVQK